MAQNRSTQIISMIKWIRTNRLTVKNFLSPKLDLELWELTFGEILGVEQSSGIWNTLSLVSREGRGDGDKFLPRDTNLSAGDEKSLLKEGNWVASKVNLPHAINFRTLCGADLVT